MLKRLLSCKKGEGYIEMCIGVIAFVMVLVIAINIFSFITLKVEIDQIAEDLIEVATYTGEFGDDFWDACSEAEDKYGDYELECGADEYFNNDYQHAQLGERMWVIVSKETYIKGLGVFKIPTTVSVRRSGLSEKYWK